jgi:hypothetical protein
MNPISGISPIAASLNGLRQADQALEAAVAAVNSGSLDLDGMAKAAALLQSADIQAGASAVTLRAGLDLQRHAIDILA